MGVRWLKYLHAVAHYHDRAADKVQSECIPQAIRSHATAADSAAEKGQTLSSDQLANELHSICVSGCEAEQSSTPDNLYYLRHRESTEAVKRKECGNCNDDETETTYKSKGESEQERCVSWQASAREYATVQEWFCFLVRSYFKVCSLQQSVIYNRQQHAVC